MVRPAGWTAYVLSALLNSNASWLDRSYVMEP